VEIEGSSAIVVGGASGLGEATVRRLHASGAAVTVADLNAERGTALAAELDLAFVGCDVRDEQDVERAIEQAHARAGGLRIAICCAGTGWAQKLAGTRGPHELAPFESVVSINLIGTFNVLRYAASAMIANAPTDGGERGVIVNTASIAAYDGQIGQIAYAASKGGVVGMTLPAARDLAKYGVRVNTIAPGLFDTPLLAALPEAARTSLGAGVPFPKRLGHPAEYAQLACQLVENRMLNGETIRLDGALRMPPR
jgi:NAD(P)-dependent dehydrogenase (short-subunit alcohol dehydrogenase family)